MESRVIPEGLRPLALAAPGTRNILVHGYAEIRHDLVHETLEERPRQASQATHAPMGGGRTPRPLLGAQAL